MGIEALEDKFQHYKEKYSQNIAELKSLALQIVELQQQIRNLLRDITPNLCTACESKCCSGMPIEGWFTAEDYFAYRMLYDAPHDLKISSSDQFNCSFLTATGCSLPENMRPLACVKVNCVNLNRMLKEKDKLAEFKKICEELDEIQVKLWQLVDGQEQQ